MDSKNIFELVNKYKYSVLLIVLLSGICAVIFSSKHFITPLYRSKVVLYPTSTYSISKSLFNTNKLIFVDPLEIGDEEQTAQMLEILRSNIIRDQIIEKYDLKHHYGINESQKYQNTSLYKTYDSRIKFRKTEYEAVLINVLDPDPVYAAKIANDIASLFDSTMNQLQKSFTDNALRIVEEEYKNAVEYRKMLTDSLKQLYSYDIYDYEIQMTSLSEQLAIEIAKGNKKGIDNIKEKINNLNKYRDVIDNINNELEQNLQYTTNIKRKLDEARIDATQTIPHKFVVSSAYISEKPCYPIRLVIVITTMLSTFMLLILILALTNSQSEQKKS